MIKDSTTQYIPPSPERPSPNELFWWGIRRTNTFYGNCFINNSIGWRNEKPTVIRNAIYLDDPEMCTGNNARLRTLEENVARLENDALIDMRAALRKVLK